MLRTFQMPLVLAPNSVMSQWHHMIDWLYYKCIYNTYLMIILI